MRILILLKFKSIKHLTEKQKKERMDNLQRIKEYANRKIFPVNDVKKHKTPYFIDNFGTYCAVADVLAFKGEFGIIESVMETDPFARIIEINSPKFEKWAASSGLSIKELGEIQPAYSPHESISISTFAIVFLGLVMAVFTWITYYFISAKLGTIKSRNKAKIV